MYRETTEWIRECVSRATKHSPQLVSVVNFRSLLDKLTVQVVITSQPTRLSEMAHDIEDVIGAQFESSSPSHLLKKYGLPKIWFKLSTTSSAQQILFDIYEAGLSRRDSTIRDLQKRLDLAERIHKKTMNQQYTKLTSERKSDLTKERIRLDRKLGQVHTTLNKEHETEIDTINRMWKAFLDEQYALCVAEHERSTDLVLRELRTTKEQLAAARAEVSKNSEALRDDAERLKQVVDEVVSSRSMILPFRAIQIDHRTDDSVDAGGGKGRSPVRTLPPPPPLSPPLVSANTSSHSSTYTGRRDLNTSLLSGYYAQGLLDTAKSGRSCE
eukprot:g1171.t1